MENRDENRVDLKKTTLDLAKTEALEALREIIKSEHASPETKVSAASLILSVIVEE